MVYIYVCKRFKVSMDMVSGRDGDWVNNLLQNYCKHARVNAKLERAEINPKKRTNVQTFDSSLDVFKINLVYKDHAGAEHELKWVIKVTRSDSDKSADDLLRHEKQVFARLISDLINTVKQKAAGRLEGSRADFRDLIRTPDFIFEETTHAADLMRNVLVLENLEEKNFSNIPPGITLNLPHMRYAIKAMAKFHAVSIAFQQLLFASFLSQEASAEKSRKVDEVVMEGEQRVLTGRKGLFSRFSFLKNRRQTMSHLIDNRDSLFDMFQTFLECFPEESHLLDVFEYVRISADDILYLNEDVEGDDYKDSKFDSICLGMIQPRSFLFKYEEDDDDDDPKAKDSKDGKKGGKGRKSSKLQRSQSERIKDRSKSVDPARLAKRESMNKGKENKSNQNASSSPHHAHHPNTVIHQAIVKNNQNQQQQESNNNNSQSNSKCPKLEISASISAAATAPLLIAKSIAPASVSNAPSTPTIGGGGPRRVQNKFLTNVIGKSKDDENVPLTNLRRGAKPAVARDPNEPPREAALINCKFVSYGPITRDLALLFWTCGSTLIRRRYFIKMIENYVETLGISLNQLGIDTDQFGLKYQDVVMSVQEYQLYGFMVTVLLCMSATSREDLEKLKRERLNNNNNSNSANKNGVDKSGVKKSTDSICSTSDSDATTLSSCVDRKDKDVMSNTAGMAPSSTPIDPNSKYLSLTSKRCEFLLDLMRDIGAYIESKDFEQGLPITNFERYHELWSMNEDDEEYEEEEDNEDEGSYYETGEED